MYVEFFKSVAETAVRSEGFAGGTSTAGGYIAAFLAVVLLVIVQLFIVQWLWNTVLVRVVSIVRPLPSLWYTFGFLILMAMIHPGYVSSEMASA
jgi:hypothetical protein